MGAVERYRNRSALVEILDRVFTSKPLAEWEKLLAQHRLTGRL